MKERSRSADTVHVIDPNGVYCVEQLRTLLRISPAVVREEKKAGRLRVSWRARRYYILGKWLLEWLEKGEVPAPKPGDRTAAKIQAKGEGS